MPYGDFALREDVYSIIAATLSEHYGSEVQVVDKNASVDPANTMYCFPQIGIIVPENPCKHIVDQVKREYRITYSYSRKLIMNTYINCIFAAPRLFCDKKMVFPSGIVNRDMFIEPGNKKIKVFDYRNKSISNIVKVGFKRDWIEKEIEYRTKNSKNYIMSLTRTREGYDEKLHIGYCYTRLENSDRVHLDKAIGKILLDYSVDAGIKYGRDYLWALVLNIESFFSENPVIDYERLIDLLKRICVLLEAKKIPLCISHGDFQRGNIFLDIEEENIYIIDWETWGIRSIWYDKFLFYYNFRNSTKLLSNIEKYLKDDGKLLGIAKDKDCKIQTLLVFIIEDIMWQVNEMRVLPEGCKSNGIVVYSQDQTINEISRLIEEVNR